MREEKALFYATKTIKKCRPLWIIVVHSMIVIIKVCTCLFKCSHASWNLITVFFSFIFYHLKSVENKKIIFEFLFPAHLTDNLNGSKLNDTDSGIDSSSYNSSNIINAKCTDAKPSNGDARSMSSNDKYEAKKSIFILIGIFSVSLIAMFYVYLMFPKLEE